MATKKLQILDSLNKDAVLYMPQELTDEQKAQVRENIDVPSLVDGKIPVEQLPDGFGTGDGNVNLTNYYTKGETDTALSGKADLVDGKIPASQLPDDISSGDGLTEVDWETNVINKPFEDTRVISLYSYAENPNPVSFDCAAIGYSLYKISDLVLTKEEIFNTKITINGYEVPKYSQNNVLVETDELILAQEAVTNGWAFCFCNTVGTCNFTFSGYPLSVDVPEVGIYRVNVLDLGMSDIITIEIFVSGELKTLDSKYIADMYYDTRKISYYSQAENPNPLQVDNAMLNASLYLVSDLVPTRNEIFNSTKLIINGQEYTLDESGIQFETDDFIYVCETKLLYSFIFVNKSGTLNFTASGYPMSLEMPKAGIYYQRALNAGVPEGRTIEFIIGELKQIDPKFIPADLDFNLDDYYTKVETYSKSEVDAAINSVDLSNYYTKDKTYSKSELDEIIGDIDTIINEINDLIGE